MYIIKNAFKCISRSIGRNILIGIIVLVISTAACVGLSIQQAAENARTEVMEGLSVTATIDFDRSALMEEMRGTTQSDSELQNEPPSFDKNQFAQKMGENSSLTLEEYQTYAQADSVEDFYYVMSVSLNGTDDFEPVSSTENSTQNDTTQTADNQQMGDFGGDMQGDGRERMMGAQSDFTVEGYSSEDAMTSFKEGTATITEGSVFEEGTEEYTCIISEELATYNDISVGDKIKVTNPNNEDEVYKLEVVGLYTDTSSNSNSFSMMGATSTDPANKIYMSYNALQGIVDESSQVSETTTDENTGMEFETGLSGTLTGTYVFADTDSYYEFEEQARELGLEDSYTISSQDISEYENSLVPLETLSKTAKVALIVILIIGAIILIVLNIFNVRERKYEIGVLTAMGMKKSKVALQFLTEIFAVTLAAVIIGVGIGAVTAVPVTNQLLSMQSTSQEQNMEKMEQNFGRSGAPDGMGDIEKGDQAQGGRFEQMFGAEQVNNYITEINSAMNFTVVWQMLLIAILLTLVSGMVSMLFIMRYEPLKILANRD